MTDSTSLVPSTFDFGLAMLPSPTEDEIQPLEPGQVQGIVLVVPAEEIPSIFALFERWFADREDVGWVDTGTSAHAEQGYIILEWDECEIDPLFLAIVREEELVLDYLIYTREKEA